MVTGRPHDLEQLDEVRALHRQSLASALRRWSRNRHDHLAHGGYAVAVEEHVLGAAQADAFGAEGARGHAASVGVSALVRTFIRRTRRPTP
jgi:hypothetical protein